MNACPTFPVAPVTRTRRGLLTGNLGQAVGCAQNTARPIDLTEEMFRDEALPPSARRAHAKIPGFRSRWFRFGRLQRERTNRGASRQRDWARRTGADFQRP